MNTLRVFNHYMHVRYLLLGVFQALMLIVLVYVAARIRFLGYAVPMTEEPVLLLPQAFVFSAALMFGMCAVGVLNPRLRDGHLQVTLRVLTGCGLGALLLMLLFYVLPSLYLGRGVFALALALGLVLSLTIQIAFYLAVDRSASPWRVLFLGAGENAGALLAFLRRRSDQRLFHTVGCVPVEGEERKVSPSLLLDSDASLLSHVRALRVDEIVVAMDDNRRGFPTDELLACRMAGVNIIDTVTFYERQTGKVKTELLKPSWFIFSYGFRVTPVQDFVKRVVDITASLLLMPIALPVMAGVALAIMIEEGTSAPLLFRQRRVGHRGRVFEIWKFRSMIVDAERAGVAQWATRNDPRVTRVGGVIRKYRLDELPQLFNVLRGEMSLVGPRPERPEFVSELAVRLPYYRIREHVRPGITGWAQVGYPYGASEDDANSKLQLDLYYIKNRSVFLDLLILLGTVEVVLLRKGGR
ncbi:sugar transferase [Salinisphaera dokdonensis CL-ES53]|uniref:Sugar transferase n=1 Tax=Salinisphaera dokdonensis CL-ES53 TaxID=1304272 RepID=A0ABV2B498_9GAMM